MEPCYKLIKLLICRAHKRRSLPRRRKLQQRSFYYRYVTHADNEEHQGKKKREGSDRKRERKTKRKDNGLQVFILFVIFKQ